MTFGGIVITWILCGLVAGAIGASRGVGFFLHAVIGFLFGPIGILTALLFKPSDADTYESKGEASGLVKCPMCAELVKAEAQICKHCRSDLSKAAQTVKEHSVATELYRLYQIEEFSDRFEVMGNRFDSLEEAKKWIDKQ